MEWISVDKAIMNKDEPSAVFVFEHNGFDISVIVSTEPDNKDVSISISHCDNLEQGDITFNYDKLKWIAETLNRSA